jgi:hypothetical protein
MKLCTRHQHDLMTEIRRRGLGRFIAPDDAEMVRRAQAWLAGQCQRHDLDPVAISTFELYAKAIEVCGDYVNSTVHEYCPLCEISGHSQSRNIDAVLVGHCTNAVLAVFVENELVAA